MRCNAIAQDRRFSIAVLAVVEASLNRIASIEPAERSNASQGVRSFLTPNPYGTLLRLQSDPLGRGGSGSVWVQQAGALGSVWQL